MKIVTNEIPSASARRNPPSLNVRLRSKSDEIVDVELSPEQGLQLVSSLHQAYQELMALLETPEEPPAGTRRVMARQLETIQSGIVGNALVLMFDLGKPSESSFQFSSDQAWALGQIVTAWVSSQPDQNRTTH